VYRWEPVWRAYYCNQIHRCTSIDICNISTFVIYGCGNLDLVLGRNRATASHGPLVRMHRWYAIHVSLFSTQTMCGQELIAFLRMEARAHIIGVYMCW